VVIISEHNFQCRPDLDRLVNPNVDYYPMLLTTPRITPPVHASSWTRKTVADGHKGLKQQSDLR